MGKNLTKRSNGTPHTNPPYKTVIALKVARDVLHSFSTVISNILKAEEKYNISYDDLKSIDFSNVAALKEITESLSNEKLGILFGVATEILTVQNNISNFPNYNKDELEIFNNKLIGIVEKLNMVLEE